MGHFRKILNFLKHDMLYIKITPNSTQNSDLTTKIPQIFSFHDSKNPYISPYKVLKIGNFPNFGEFQPGLNPKYV